MVWQRWQRREPQKCLYHLKRRRKGLLADSKHQGGESPRCDVVALRGSGENEKRGSSAGDCVEERKAQRLGGAVTDVLW